jgi:hypothetical protein
MSETPGAPPQAMIRISSIEILKTEITAPKTEGVPIRHSYTVNLQNKIDVENRLIDVLVSVLIHGDEQKEKYASFETKISFQVEDISPVVQKLEDSQLRVNSAFLITLNSISISTTRGLIFSLMKGTFLDKSFLPIIDPKQFVPVDAIAQREIQAIETKAETS